MMDVLSLQRTLAGLGYYKGALDDLQGPQTIAAIQAFQTARGLKPDGVVGPQTITALGTAPHAASGLPTTVSPDCVDCVKGFEGLGDGDPHTVLLEPYFDQVGVATLGWGHAILGPDGKKIRARFKGDPLALVAARAAVTKLFGAPAITVAQAKSLLSMDINARLGQIAPLLEGMETSQAELDGLMSLGFNIGMQALGNSTVLRMHKIGAPVSATLDFAALEKLSQAHQAGPGMAAAFGAYSIAGGDWALGLFRRRMAEAMIYRGDGATKALPVAMAIR